MRQGVLSFQYEQEKRGSGMTALAPNAVGVVSGLDLRGQAAPIHQATCAGARWGTGVHGCSGHGAVPMLSGLNLAGGEAVEDLKSLEKDEGLCIPT